MNHDSAKVEAVFRKSSAKSTPKSSLKSTPKSSQKSSPKGSTKSEISIDLPPPPPPELLREDENVTVPTVVGGQPGFHPTEVRLTVKPAETLQGPKMKCYNCGVYGFAKNFIKKSKSSVIYEKLDHFYTNFKAKQPSDRQPFPDEVAATTCKFPPLLCLDKKVRRIMWSLGGKLVDTRALMILVPLVICALATIGVIIKRKSLEVQPPFAGIVSQYDEIPIKITFNSTNPSFNSFERNSPSDFALILKAGDQENILTNEYLETYSLLKRKVESIRITSSGGKELKYDAMCRRFDDSTCGRDMIETTMDNDHSMRVHYPGAQLLFNNTTVDVFFENVIGGVYVADDGMLKSAEALAMYFKLAPKFEREFERWDAEFQRVMKNEPLTHLQRSWWSYDSFRTTVDELLLSVYSYLCWSLLVLTVATVIAFSTWGSRWSQPVLGLASTIVIVIILAGAICIDVSIAGNFNIFVFPAYFIAAACTLLIIVNFRQSWYKYSNMQIVEKEKFKFILCWESSNLVLVSFALLATFAIGSICISLPLFQRTCYFMAACSAFLLTFVLFVYLPMLYVCGRRENCGFKWYHFNCPYPKDSKLQECTEFNYSQFDVESLHKKLLNQPRLSIQALIETFCASAFRYMLISLYLVYLIFSTWGCSRITVQLDENVFLRPNDTQSSFMSDYKHFYGPYSNYMELTFDGYVDYYNPNVRRTIADMLSWIQNDLKAAERTVSWLKDIDEYERSVGYLISRDGFVSALHSGFLRDRKYKSYASDLQINLHTDQILGTRMYIKLNEVGLSRQAEIARTLLFIAKNNNLPLKIKSPAVFSLSHDVNIVWHTVLTLIVVVLLLCLFTFVLFVQPLLTFVTALCTVSTVIGSIGYGSLWGVPLNAFNINIILAGIAYTAIACTSFCYSYTNSDKDGTKTRLYFAYRSNLHGLLWSTLIPILAALPLLLIECEFIAQQVKVLFLHLSFTWLHCSLFVPMWLVCTSSCLTPFCKTLSLCFSRSCCPKPKVNPKPKYYLSMAKDTVIDPMYVQDFYKYKFHEDITQQQPMETPIHTVMPDPAAYANQVPMNPASKVYRYSSKPMDPNVVFVRSRSERHAKQQRVEEQPVSYDDMWQRIDQTMKHSRMASQEWLEQAGSADKRRGRDNVNSYDNTVSDRTPTEVNHGWNPAEVINDYTPKNRFNDFSPKEEPVVTSPEVVDGNSSIVAVRKKKSRRSKSSDDRFHRLDRVDQMAELKKKNILSYSKWTKEIPIDERRTERVIAEKYTLEADGREIPIPPYWAAMFSKPSQGHEVGIVQPKRRSHKHSRAHTVHVIREPPPEKYVPIHRPETRLNMYRHTPIVVPFLPYASIPHSFAYTQPYHGEVGRGSGSRERKSYERKNGRLDFQKTPATWY